MNKDTQDPHSRLLQTSSLCVVIGLLAGARFATFGEGLDGIVETLFIFRH
jgi:hypothetical protein